MADRPVFLPVAAAYDRWSTLYDGYANPMVFAASRVVEATLGDVCGKDVVEFGCGTGRNLSALKALGARSLAGCDVSAGMLAKARERDRAFQLFHCDMGQRLPMPEGSADLALFCLSLEHVPELFPPLCEAKRLLRPKGRLAVIEIHPFLTLSGVSAHFQDGVEEVRMPTIAHEFSSYIGAFAATGLHLTACREWRPRDFAVSAPPKVLKRGPDLPLIVQFSASS